VNSIKKYEAKLSKWNQKTLSMAGKATLINSVLTPLIKKYEAKLSKWNQKTLSMAGKAISIFYTFKTQTYKIKNI